MTSLSPLAPSIAVERLFPRNAAFVARTDLEQTRLMVFEPWNLDSITNIFLGLMNGLATVRHRAGVTDEILALFERAGVPVAEDLRVYDSGEEAERFADELVAEGRKLFFLYPLRANRFPSSGYLVTPALWARLNSKATLAELVPASHLAPRQIHSLSELEGRAFERPVYLKDASLEASGGGCAIRACLDADAWRRALKELREIGARRFVVEDALPVERCWCVALVIEQDQTSYAGAAEQVFGTPGQQTGNLIDPEHPLPAEGVRLAVEVGERARRAGFVGVAGLDIGLTSDRRLIVFDPNFRINSSSSQSLLHDSAARRAGSPFSHSTHVSTSLPFAEVARRLAGPIDDGWFIPTRCLDAAWLPGRAGGAVCEGFVLAADRASAITAAERLSALISG